MVKVYRFAAPWCIPCKALTWRLDGLGIALPEYNVDDPSVKPLLDRFRVKTVPTIVIEEADGVYQTFVGTAINDVLLQRLAGRWVHSTLKAAYF